MPGDYPQVRALVVELGITIPYAVGILVMLHWWSKRYIKHGRIGRYSNETIADGLGIDGEIDPDRLIAALVATRFIRHSEAHRLVIRDASALMPWKDPRLRRWARLRAAGGEISRLQRLRIYERDDFRCRMCLAIDDLTIDHVHPICDGGTNDDANLQTLCRRCNSRKGPRLSVGSR